MGEKICHRCENIEKNYFLLTSSLQKQNVQVTSFNNEQHNSWATLTIAANFQKRQMNVRNTPRNSPADVCRVGKTCGQTMDHVQSQPGRQIIKVHQSK